MPVRTACVSVRACSVRWGAAIRPNISMFVDQLHSRVVQDYCECACVLRHVL